MSRTIFAAALATGLALAIGCGSKPEPTLPNVPLDGDPTPPGSDRGTPPGADQPKAAAWELDPTKHAIPATPVKGSVAGADFTPEVVIEGTELIFRTTKPDAPDGTSVRVRLAPTVALGQPSPSVLGRSWKVAPDTPGRPTVPEVWIEVAGKQPTVFPTGYALTLELGARKGGKVAGKVYLSINEDAKSFLAGTFEAEYFRPHTEPPSLDDVPYIAGTVAVTGANPDAQVRVSYAAFAPSAVLLKEVQIPFEQVENARWTRDETDKPRTSTLVAGDGKERPFRYDHVNLPPGRYLLAAAVVGGPAAWKWVDVSPGAALTVNLAIDATKTGAVQVSVPAGVTGKVLVAPADEPTRPALEPELFSAIASQVVRQDIDIVGGKATVKDLGPGTYEVRAGDLRGTVEVVAGKTADLTLTPPKK